MYAVLGSPFLIAPPTNASASGSSSPRSASGTATVAASPSSSAAAVATTSQTASPKPRIGRVAQSEGDNRAQSRCSLEAASDERAFGVLVCVAALARAKDFLPRMAVANDRLRQDLTTNPEGRFDIERIDDDSKPYIEMVRRASPCGTARRRSRPRRRGCALAESCPRRPGGTAISDGGQPRHTGLWCKRDAGFAKSTWQRCGETCCVQRG